MKKSLTKATTALSLALGAVALASGCAMKTKIMDVSGISTTKLHLKEGEKLEETGPVRGEFCSDARHDTGTVGLLDEATRHAQQEHGVDFITNAVFYSTGNCVSIEGTGQKIVASSDDAPKKKKNKKRQ